MPSGFPSSFASAAAGAPSNDTQGTGGEWLRRPQATTFRRQSGFASKTEPLTTPAVSGLMPNPQTQVPSRDSIDTRYSKDQLLDLFRLQQENDNSPPLHEVLLDGWNPTKNGASQVADNRRWSSEQKEAHGPELCWDQDGSVQPLGLVPLTSEEKEIFSTTVNSPIKPQNKEGAPQHRRSSFSQQNQFNGTSLRSGGRLRKDSTEQNPRSAKEDFAAPSDSLLRRKTDYKESFARTLESREKEDDVSAPFSATKRAATNPLGNSTWGNGPSSGSFGAFGSFGGQPLEKRPGFGSVRGESRFKSLMSGDVGKEGNVTDLYADDENALTGSAALGGDKASPPLSRMTRPFDEPEQASHRHSQNLQTPHREQLGPAGEPLSPTYTNPYLSPDGERVFPEEADNNEERTFRHPPTNTSEDRPANRRELSNATGLKGLGGGGPWGSGSGTPGKAFGDSAFAGFGDNSTAFGSGLFSSNTGGLPPSRSKLGALFQDQRNDGTPLDFSQNHATITGRELESGSGSASRTRLDDLMNDSMGAPLSGENRRPPSVPLQGVFPGDSSNSQADLGGDMPAPQQRQMVMPDRMRWIYRDPQGNQQGPWSGLEMHDWYKAGFFTAELQVKKIEDVEYEPLAQLIRRIGNSREPFLVPQIGIAHGPPPTAGGSGTTPGTAGAASVQPPFANNFPSFGTTLTADQQNALERRKQEEQYLMARQKEHLAQMQPVLQRQMQQHIQNQQHSQSFGGMSGGPATFPNTPSSMNAPGAQGSMMPGQSDTNISRNNMSSEDLPGYMDRMKQAQGSQQLKTDPNYQQALQDRANLRMQQQQQQQRYTEREGERDVQITAHRLEEYHRLRAQESEQQEQAAQRDLQEQGADHDARYESMSLSEQVQKAAAQVPHGQAPGAWAKVDTEAPAPSASPMPAPTPQRNRQSVADALNAESQAQVSEALEAASAAAVAPWAKDPVEGSKGPSLKEIQAMEARKAAQQEEIAAAARRAIAEQERHAQQQQAQAQVTASGPGLPSSANWAAATSPSLTASANPISPWAKANAGKTGAASPGTLSKKTLAQIQKEEEARKNKATAAQAGAAGAPGIGPGGKRYADLAGKASASAAVPAASGTGSAWTTVGASGKVRTPSGVAPARTSSNAGLAGAPVSAKARPSASPQPPVKSSVTTPQQHAIEEFQRWTRDALGTGLNASIPVDEFISSLLHLPLEADIISDSIYASSQTLDGRRFAEEFVRRRKLADRGVAPADAGSGFNRGANGGTSTSSHEVKGNAGGGSGWSEVAKKGGSSNTASAKENGQFRVVAGKKKGRK